MRAAPVGHAFGYGPSGPVIEDERDAVDDRVWQGVIAALVEGVSTIASRCARLIPSKVAAFRTSSGRCSRDGEIFRRVAGLKAGECLTSAVTWSWSQ